MNSLKNFLIINSIAQSSINYGFSYSYKTEMFLTVYQSRQSDNMFILSIAWSPSDVDMINGHDDEPIEVHNDIEIR